MNKVSTVKSEEVIGSIEIEVIHKETHDLIKGHGTIGEMVDHCLSKQLNHVNKNIRTVTVHIDEERM